LGAHWRRQSRHKHNLFRLALMAMRLANGYSPLSCDPPTLLSAWCAGRATPLQTRRILALLDLQHMLSLPLHSRTIRRARCPDNQWYCFLFRRHVQYILLWAERRNEGHPHGFSDDVNWILRYALFPDPPNPLEDGQHVGGGAEPARCDVTCSIASASTLGSVCSSKTSTGRSGGPTTVIDRGAPSSARPSGPRRNAELCRCDWGRAAVGEPRTSAGEQFHWQFTYPLLIISLPATSF
jgi:hypothetical protein